MALADLSVNFVPARNLRLVIRCKMDGYVRDVYRSSALCKITAGELAHLKFGFPVSYFDLRTELERQKEPLSELADCQVVPYPVSIGDPNEPWIQPVEYSLEHLMDIYIRYVEGAIPAVNAILHWLSNSKHGTAIAITACSAGKDRTGVVMFLLLTALGFSEATVIEDYAYSFAELDKLDSSTPFGRSFTVPRRMPPHQFMAQFAAEMRSRDIMSRLDVAAARDCREHLTVARWCAVNRTFEYDENSL